ncbi:MAG: family 1 extracellular solute-binding protein [Paenibacillaceae bacterium]|nr:family 1 extracellular solute-binding protein [Paenibacillaceae bacterium]
MESRKTMKWLAAVGLSAMLLVLGGCGQGGNGKENAGNAGNAASGTENKISSEPMTLTVFQHQSNISDDEFQRLIAAPVSKKYPNITMELIHSSADNTPESLIANGTLPDIVYGALGSVSVFSDLGANIDLTELAKKYKLDFTKFDTAAIKSIQARGQNGQTLAIPYSINFSAMFYNKDIFDQFGVAYPKNGITWEETAQLARKLTREAGGTQYQGFGLDGGTYRLGEQLSLPLVDPKTNKAVYASGNWNRVYDVMKLFFDIPGYDSTTNTQDMFFKEFREAMLVSQGARVGLVEEMFNQGKPMNWGIASLPSFKDAPGKGYYPAIPLLMITTATKHKDEAFQVLNLLTDADTQKEMGKGGRLSSLKDAKVRETFGQDMKSFKGVDIKAIVDYATSTEPPYSKYSDMAKNQVDAAIRKALSGATDINTALRESEEATNKKIAEAIATGK